MHCCALRSSAPEGVSTGTAGKVGVGPSCSAATADDCMRGRAQSLFPPPAFLSRLPTIRWSLYPQYVTSINVTSELSTPHLLHVVEAKSLTDVLPRTRHGLADYTRVELEG